MEVFRYSNGHWLHRDTRWRMTCTSQFQPGKARRGKVLSNNRNNRMSDVHGHLPPVAHLSAQWAHGAVSQWQRARLPFFERTETIRSLDSSTLPLRPLCNPERCLRVHNSKNKNSSSSSSLPATPQPPLPQSHRNTHTPRPRQLQHRARSDSMLVSTRMSLNYTLSAAITWMLMHHLPWYATGTQYQVLDVVGEGAYGIVCSAIHRPSGRKVAIKKIAPFDHSMFCLRTLRELKLLKFLSEAGVSENVCPPTLPSRPLY